MIVVWIAETMPGLPVIIVVVIARVIIVAGIVVALVFLAGRARMVVVRIAETMPGLPVIIVVAGVVIIIAGVVIIIAGVVVIVAGVVVIVVIVVVIVVVIITWRNEGLLDRFPDFLANARVDKELEVVFRYVLRADQVPVTGIFIHPIAISAKSERQVTGCHQPGHNNKKQYRVKNRLPQLHFPHLSSLRES
jgi:hypothetical protein